MTKPNIVLIGAGGHSHACIDVIEQQAKFNIAGLVGLECELGQQHFGYEVIGEDQNLPNLAQKYQYAIVTLGHLQSSDNRKHMYDLIKRLGFEVPFIISPRAHVSRHATLGEGTIIMHDVIVNAGAAVGVNCIINSKALVEHDVVVSNHCHISTGVILNGGVTIGSGTFVGSGSVVKQGLVVGNNSVVGMGLSVRHNLAEETFFTGQYKK